MKQKKSDQVIAQRTYEWRPARGKPRKIEVCIGAPEPTAGARDWGCRVRITGLPRTKDLDILVRGVDAVQAIELALVAAGKELSRSPEMRAGQILAWGEKAENPMAL